MAVVVKNGVTYDLPDSQLEEAARQGYEVIGAKKAEAIERERDDSLKPVRNIGETLAAGVGAAAAGIVDAAIAPAKALAAGVVGLESAADTLLGATPDAAARAAAQQRARDVSAGLLGLGVTNDYLRQDVADVVAGNALTGGVSDAYRTPAALAKWLLSRISGRQVNADVQAASRMPVVGADAARAEGDAYDAESRRLAQENPGAAFIGGVTGNVVGGLLTGGGLSSAAVRGTTGLAGRLGLMAADGALGGVGAADESAWLRDGGRAKAEDVLASMGIGAVLGGALGGLGEAGGSLWRRATSGMTADPGLALPPQAIEALAGKGAVREAAAVAQPITAQRAKELVGGIAGLMGYTKEEAETYARGLTSKTFREFVNDPNKAAARTASDLAESLESADRIAAQIQDTFASAKPGQVRSWLAKGGGLSEAEQVAAAKRIGFDALNEIETEVGAIAGEKAVIAKTRGVSRVTRQRLESASTPGEAFLALEEGKRVLGNAISDSRTALESGKLKNLYDREKALKIFGTDGGDPGAIGRIQERMRQALEDETVWGAAGVAQRERNAAASQLISLRDQARKLYTKEFDEKALAAVERYEAGLAGEVAESHIGKFAKGKTRLVDEETFAKNLMRSGTTEARFGDRAFDAYLAALDDLGTVVAKHGADGVDANKLSGTVSKIKQVRDEHISAMRGWNALQEAQQRGGTSVVKQLGDAAPVLGALIGGPAGAAVGGTLSLVARGATDPTGTIRAVARLDRITELVDGRISTGARDLLRSSRSVLPRANREATGRSAARAAGYAGARFARPGQSPSDAYAEKAAAIETALADPAKLAEDAEGSLGEVARRFPGLTEQLLGTSVGVAAFLQSKMPAPPTQETVFGGQRVGVSDREAERWGAYWVAATDPLSVLDLARSGQLQREHVEALQACYPDLHARLSAAIVGEIRAGKTPYAARVAADRLLGLDGAGEPSDSPEAQLQRAAAAQSQQPQPRQSRQAPRIDAGAPASATIWR